MLLLQLNAIAACTTSNLAYILVLSGYTGHYANTSS